MIKIIIKDVLSSPLSSSARMDDFVAQYEFHEDSLNDSSLSCTSTQKNIPSKSSHRVRIIPSGNKIFSNDSSKSEDSIPDSTIASMFPIGF